MLISTFQPWENRDEPPIRSVPGPQRRRFSNCGQPPASLPSTFETRLLRSSRWGGEGIWWLQNELDNDDIHDDNSEWVLLMPSRSSLCPARPTYRPSHHLSQSTSFKVKDEITSGGLLSLPHNSHKHRMERNVENFGTMQSTIWYKFHKSALCSTFKGGRSQWSNRL